MWSGGAREHYVSEISDQKWALKIRPVIAHIKVFFHHMSLRKRPINLACGHVQVPVCSSCVCIVAVYLFFCCPLFPGYNEALENCTNV